jgi:hypothetical protein
MKFFFSALFSLFFILLGFSVHAQNPFPQTDTLLDVPFFHSNRMAFPKWVVEGKRGHRMNASTKKKIDDKDTLHLLAPLTSLLIRMDPMSDRKTADTIASIESRAFLSGDTLFVLCEYQPTLSPDILELKITPALCGSQIIEGASRKPDLISQHVLFRHLTFQKLAYKRGDILKAELDFNIEYQLNDVARGPYSQRIYYKGWMKCKIE